MPILLYPLRGKTFCFADAYLQSGTPEGFKFRVVIPRDESGLAKRMQVRMMKFRIVLRGVLRGR